MTGIHVLHLIDGLNVGGAEVLLRDLAFGLAQRGYRVSVGYSTPGPLAAELEAMAIPLHRLPRRARVDPSLLLGMLRLMRADPPHVVHTHLFKSDFHGRLAARMAGVPVVVSTLHNADIWARRWPLGFLYGQTARFTDSLIAVSAEVRQYHLKHTGIPPRKVIVIENGVDVRKFKGLEAAGKKVREEFGIQPEALLFGIIARLKPQKDHATFLKAAAEIIHKQPAARFLVVGDGPLLDDLRHQAEELGLTQAVIFAGLRQDIPAVMAALDVLVFSSQWEGLPVTLLEGMAAGKPIAATAVDGIKGVAVEGQTALLVPPGDPSALARACLKLADEPGLRERLGTAGRERVSAQYSLDAMVGRTADLYTTLLQMRGFTQNLPGSALNSGVLMTAPIRLLLVTKSTGGVAEYIRQLVPALDPREFAVTVACLSENGPKFAAELSAHPGVKAFSLEMNRYKVDPVSDLRTLLALRSHLRREKYDLVHAHASKPGFLARLAAFGTRVPVLYSPHCFAFHTGAGRLSARIVALLESFAARYLTTRILVVADGERHLARSYGVGWDDLFTTVHTGMDARKFRAPADRIAVRTSLGVPPGAPLVCSVGRLNGQKMPLDFVRMAGIVHRQRPDVHFLWVGEGPLETEARALGRELGLGGVLHFAGQRGDVPAILQVIDCFVLPSLWEGFPLSLLEAMATGAPVVATDIPGNDEAVRPGVDGWLVPARAPESLAGAVLECVNDPVRAAALSTSARRRVEQEFTLRNMLDGIIHVYRQVIEASQDPLTVISPEGQR